MDLPPHMYISHMREKVPEEPSALLEEDEKKKMKIFNSYSGYLCPRVPRMVSYSITHHYENKPIQIY